MLLTIEKIVVLMPIDERDEDRGSRAEAGRPGEDARAETQVLKQLLDADARPHRARVFFHQRDVAELNQRLTSRLVRGHAALDVGLDLPLDVVAQLLVEVVVTIPSPHIHVPRRSQHPPLR